MLKKVLPVILSVLLLAGCSAQKTESNSIQQKNDPNKEITLTWWNSVDDDDESKALQTIVDKYKKVHPNVNIQRTYIPFKDIKNKLLTSAVANDLPDIVWLDNPDHQSFAAAGILADITPEIKEWGQGEKYYKGPWSSTMFEDKNYGVPISSNNLALFYNVKMLKDAGINPPKTWDELKEAAARLTKNGVYGLAVSAKQDETATFQLLPWIWQAGSDLTNLNSEGTLQALKLWKEMIDKGYMSKDVITQSHGDTTLQFAGQKVAMIVSGTWNLGGELPKANFEWGIVPLPTNKQSATILGGFNWAIVSKTKNKEAAWEFIKFANEPENIKEFVHISKRLPSRKDLIQDPLWQQDKNMKIFADSMEGARARAYGPNYPKISKSIQDMVQSVLTGIKSPEDAVKQADETIKPLLSK